MLAVEDVMLDLGIFGGLVVAIAVAWVAVRGITINLRKKKDES